MWACLVPPGLEPLSGRIGASYATLGRRGRRPHPYQGSPPRLVSPGSPLSPGRTITAGDRCEPLGSDGMWPKRGPVTSSSGQYPPAGPARQHRHSEPTHTACRCGRAMRWPRPKRGRRQRRHPRLRMIPTRRPSPPCRLVVAARSARDRKARWLPSLCPEDRQTEVASVLPKPCLHG